MANPRSKLLITFSSVVSTYWIILGCKYTTKPNWSSDDLISQHSLNSKHKNFYWTNNIVLKRKITQISNAIVHQLIGLTLSLGLPPEPCGDPAAADCTRTNSSLVTVATDSVELLTFPSEEQSSMSGWFTQSQTERPGLTLSTFLLLSAQLCWRAPCMHTKRKLSTEVVFWYLNAKTWFVSDGLGCLLKIIMCFAFKLQLL